MALKGVTAWLLSGKNSGGGSGGTDNYNNLTNKPSVNSVELTGNKKSSDLGIVSATATYDSENENVIIGGN